MTDWTPFSELSKREDFIRTSVAVHMANSPHMDARTAPYLARQNWESVRRAVDEEKRR